MVSALVYELWSFTNVYKIKLIDQKHGPKINKSFYLTLANTSGCVDIQKVMEDQKFCIRSLEALEIHK